MKRSKRKTITGTFLERNRIRGGILRRSVFLGSATALAAAAFLSEVGLAAGNHSVTAELAPVVDTLLPFGTSSFPPIRPEALVRRIDDLFNLGENPIFQASLRGFSSIASFSTGTIQLFAAEKVAAPEADVKELTAIDAAAFSASALPSVAAFQDLKPADRSTYIRLWSQSAFSTRRRFYGSVRAITLVAFYSLPESWQAIGYEGALLHGAHAK